MRHDRPFGPNLEPPMVPLHEEQLAALNQALTAEVLRHAETRLRLQCALERCGVLQHALERYQGLEQRALAWFQFLESVGEGTDA